jgi:Fe-S-cluster-containing hydrogenase component 2
MKKVIIVNHEKCTGCRQCELVCSVNKTGTSNPSRSRISVIKWEGEGFYLPMLCQQCQEPACMAVCPKDAISKDEELGRVVVDYDLCIGCEMCVAACPFGGMGICSVEEKVIKCDLCDGEPMCVRFCKAEALEYVDANIANLKKKRTAAEKFSELMRKVV